MATVSALDIDLYQARMLIAYYKTGMRNVQGTMEAFVRELPSNRSFLVISGIARIIDYLRNLKITDEDICVLEEALPDIKFDEDLKCYLKDIDFKSMLRVRAVVDGEIIFAKEPAISVSGPIGLVQYVEKQILAILNHDVRISSKAARIYIAAKGRPLAEFGGRRGSDMMGPEIARAAYIGGFSSTSNVLAYKKYGVPCIGTMGHVWIMSHLDTSESDGEMRAYNDWSKLFPNSSYLPDTYNTFDGVEKILDECESNIGSIRLDSGDLKEQSFYIRRLLNKRGHTKTTIGATNDLDEYEITKLLDNGCPIDWFGCGTKVVSTPDAPTCNFIYKLVEVNDPKFGYSHVAKIAANGKGTLPGAKQIGRHYDFYSNKYTHDTVSLSNVVYYTPGINNLLVPYDLVAGDSFSPQTARNYFINVLNHMPDYLKLFNSESKYTVDFHKTLENAISDFLLKRTSHG